MNILITGGAGFIGSHLADHLIQNTEHSIVFLDKIDCSGNMNRIPYIKNWEKNRARCRWVHHDLRGELNSQLRGQIGKIDVIIHMAAGTHVDRSISEPLSFVYDNMVGTANLLEYARFSDIELFINFSTDEVFGPAKNGIKFKEWDRYKSGNPYAATKAGATELGIAYHNTYKLPVITTFCMNAFGERQHPEKFIPMTIKNIRDGNEVLVHSDAKGNSGSRFYIHARNIADAILFLMDKGEVGDKYNIVGEKEVSNLELARLIAEFQGRDLNYKMIDYHSSRPGHDLRYALDGSKMEEMGWVPKMSFEDSLKKVVKWTLDNPQWLLG